MPCCTLKELNQMKSITMVPVHAYQQRGRPPGKITSIFEITLELWRSKNSSYGHDRFGLLKHRTVLLRRTSTTMRGASASSLSSTTRCLATPCSTRCALDLVTSLFFHWSLIPACVWKGKIILYPSWFEKLFSNAWFWAFSISLYTRKLLDCRCFKDLVFE